MMWRCRDCGGVHLPVEPTQVLAACGQCQSHNVSACLSRLAGDHQRPHLGFAEPDAGPTQFDADNPSLFGP